MKKYPTPKQLLGVLESGATVEFPNGYKVIGDKQRKYIETYEGPQYTGVWNLNEEGAQLCIEEAKQIDKNNKER